MKCENIADITVLIPAYEPDSKLVGVVRELKATGFNVLVVDDGSGSAYDEFFAASEEYATVLRYEVNKGKGGALKTGLAYIRDNLPDCFGIVTADSDGQHRPDDIEKIYKALADNTDSTERKLILGSRGFDGAVPLRSRMGNTITRVVFAVISGKRIYDTQTGLRAFTAALLTDMLAVSGERFDYEMNVLLECIQSGTPVSEVGISTVYDIKNHSSHFRTVADAALVYSKMLRFSMSAVAAFVIDFLLLLLFEYTIGFAPHLGAGLASVVNGFVGGMFPSFSLENQSAELLICVVAARIISSCVNFLINHKLVFRSSDHIGRAAVKYYLLVVLILIANFLIMNLLNVVIGLPIAGAKLITEVILFFVSYIFQKLLVFKGGKGKEKNSVA